MLDEFVQIMYVYYESNLDMDITTLPGEMIRYNIYKPNSKYKDYLAVYIYVSNQTKGFYIDLHKEGIIKNRINLYNVPQLIKEWDKI